MARLLIASIPWVSPSRYVDPYSRSAIAHTSLQHLQQQPQQHQQQWQPQQQQHQQQWQQQQQEQPSLLPLRTQSSYTDMSIATVPRAHGLPPTMGEVVEAYLDRDTGGLGLRVAGGQDTTLGALFVAQVFPGGAAAACGNVEVGDRIIRVQGASTLNMTQADLRHFLSTVATGGGRLQLQLMRLGVYEWGRLCQAAGIQELDLERSPPKTAAAHAHIATSQAAARAQDARREAKQALLQEPMPSDAHPLETTAPVVPRWPGEALPRGAAPPRGPSRGLAEGSGAGPTTMGLTSPNGAAPSRTGQALALAPASGEWMQRPPADGVGPDAPAVPASRHREIAAALTRDRLARSHSALASILTRRNSNPAADTASAANTAASEAAAVKAPELLVTPPTATAAAEEIAAPRAAAPASMPAKPPTSSPATVPPSACPGRTPDDRLASGTLPAAAAAAVSQQQPNAAAHVAPMAAGRQPPNASHVAPAAVHPPPPVANAAVGDGAKPQARVQVADAAPSPAAAPQLAAVRPPLATRLGVAGLTPRTAAGLMPRTAAVAATADSLYAAAASCPDVPTLAVDGSLRATAAPTSPPGPPADTRADVSTPSQRVSSPRIATVPGTTVSVVGPNSARADLCLTSGPQSAPSRLAAVVSPMPAPSAAAPAPGLAHASVVTPKDAIIKDAFNPTGAATLKDAAKPRDSAKPKDASDACTPSGAAKPGGAAMAVNVAMPVTPPSKAPVAPPSKITPAALPGPPGPTPKGATSHVPPLESVITPKSKPSTSASPGSPRVPFIPSAASPLRLDIPFPLTPLLSGKPHLCHGCALALILATLRRVCTQGLLAPRMISPRSQPLWSCGCRPRRRAVPPISPHQCLCFLPPPICPPPPSMPYLGGGLVGGDVIGGTRIDEKPLVRRRAPPSPSPPCSPVAATLTPDRGAGVGAGEGHSIGVGAPALVSTWGRLSERQSADSPPPPPVPAFPGDLRRPQRREGGDGRDNVPPLLPGTTMSAVLGSRRHSMVASVAQARPHDSAAPDDGGEVVGDAGGVEGGDDAFARRQRTSVRRENMRSWIAEQKKEITRTQVGRPLAITCRAWDSGRANMCTRMIFWT